MSTSRFQRPPTSPGGKRRRDCTEIDCLTNRAPSPFPPFRKPKKSNQSAITVYWDSFSHIPLTQSALNEVDRRAPRPRRIAIGGQPGLKSGETTKPSAKLLRACRQGGLDLRHLRGYSSVKEACEPNTEMVRHVGTTDAMFGQHLAKHGVHPEDSNITKPQNWEEILGMMEQPRPVLIPSESYDAQHQAFRQVANEAESKRDVMTMILPLIAGQSEIQIHTSGGHSFQNLEDLTDGTIVKLKPDLYDGADSDKIDAEILKQLTSFLQPLEDKKTPVVPSFFAQMKSPKSESFVVEQQARYAGALGARAIHKLRSFAVTDPEIIFDNNAYTITATYQTRVLSLYVHRPVKPPVPGGSVEYRMTIVGEFAMFHSPDSFRQAVTAFRNAREWAAKKRNEFIAAANATKQTIAIPSVPDLPAPSSCILS